MEDFKSCSVCFHEYTEKTWVPKVLECGHSFCERCLASLLQNQKSCPKCRATLSRNIEEYPTNFDLLGLSKSSKEKGNLDLFDACTLDMKNELKSKKKILEKLMIERDANTCSMESIKASMKKLLSCIKIMRESAEIANLVPDIEDCLEKVNKSLNYSSWETDKDMLRLKDYDNSEQFLREIARRLHAGKRVYACKETDDLGKWRYGKVLYSEFENQLHIHCLSSSGFERGALLVQFQDVKDCISRRESILPFIEFGSHKLWFRLTDDPSIDAFLCLQFFTGEEGHTMKGLGSEVEEFESGIFNRCTITIPSKASNRAYEDALYRQKWSDVKKDEVTLQCGLNWVIITKRSEDNIDVNFLVGKLYEYCKVDFEKIKMQNTVIDCGISLQL